MSKGISGFGTTISGATTGALGQVLRVSIPGVSVRNDIDVTTNDSPDGWGEAIAGLKDAGEITLTVLYYRNDTGTILDNLGLANESWTITFPDDSTFVCSGYVKSLGTESPHDDKISQTITIKLSGKPVFTEGSSV